MRLELIEKLADENVAEFHAARLQTETGPRLVTAQRLQRLVLATPGLIPDLGQAREAFAAARHAHLLAPLGLFEADGSHWWLSERTEGFDLATVFQRIASREVRITSMRSLQIGVDLLRGLSALHQAGLVHGGLGPRQVLVGLDGVARLDGLGIERVLMASRELRQKIRRGRKEHLAPEAMQGRAAAPSADVFSAAALVYQLLTGQSPLGDQQRGMSTRHQAVQPPSKVDRSLPFACDAVFIKALTIAPRTRQTDGTALFNAVDRLRRSLISSTDEARAGVAEFMATLFPNEAKVAGMPGTLDRPTRGEPLELVPVDEAAAAIGRRVPPVVPVDEFDQELSAQEAPVAAEPDPGGPGAITEIMPQQPLPARDWEGPGEPTPAFDVVRPQQEHARRNAPQAGSSQGPRADADLVPVAGKSPSPAPIETPVTRAAGGAPPWRKPAFLLAAGLVGLAAIALFALASGLVSSAPELGVTGPPVGQTSLIGFLSVDTGTPARITLDGEVLSNKAPLVRKVVRAGRHRLLIHARDGSALFDDFVEVPAGEHKEIRLVVASVGQGSGVFEEPAATGAVAPAVVAPDAGPPDGGAPIKDRTTLRKRTRKPAKKPAKKSTRRAKTRKRKTR